MSDATDRARRAHRRRSSPSTRRRRRSSSSGAGTRGASSPPPPSQVAAAASTGPGDAGRRPAAQPAGAGRRSLLGVLRAGGVRRHHQPRARRRARPRRPRRRSTFRCSPASRPTSRRSSPPALAPTTRRATRRSAPPSTVDAGAASADRADAGPASPCDAHERHDRPAEADRPHLRDARARARRAPSTTSRNRDADAAAARAASPSSTRRSCTSAACSACCSASSDGRSFCLLERFTVDGWVDAVRRHRPATASLVPAALRMVLDADARPRRPRAASARSSRAPRRSTPTTPTRSPPGTASRCSISYARDRVRRRRRRLEPRRPPSSSGRPSGAASAGPTPAASCASSTPTRASRARRRRGGAARGEGRASSATAGWVRTTDLARIDADGFLWILGRADQAIIRGGFKVHPDDVRAALERHPRVRGAAVVGRPDAAPRRGAGRGRRAAPRRRRRHAATTCSRTPPTVLARYELPAEIRDRRRAAAHRLGQGRPRPPSARCSPRRRGLTDGPALLRRRRGLPRGGPGVARRGRPGATARRPPPGDWPARRAYDTGWQRKLHDAGYAGLNWPAEFGGRGPAGHPAARVPRGVRRAPGAPYVGVNFVGNAHAGPTLIAEGTDEQRRVPPARASCGARACGARASPSREAGLRPRLAAHPGGARRRRVRRDRAEDLEHPRPRRRLLRAARAHRPRRAEAQGHHLADPRHAPARRRGAADADDRRREPLLRGLPRRGPRAGRRTGSARRTTAGGSPT